MQHTGIPLSDMWKSPPVPDWYYDGRLCREDRMLLMTGDGGVGKTIFTAKLMFSMALGLPFMGRDFKGRPPRFMYLDMDMGVDYGLFMHFQNVARDMGMSKDNMDEALDERIAVYCDGVPPFPSGYDIGMEKEAERNGVISPLRQALSECDPDIVIIESWSDMCGMTIDMDNNNQVNSGLRYLKSIGNDAFQWWIIHHEGKAKHGSTGSRKAVQHRGIGAQAFGKQVHRNLSITHQRRDGHASINRIEWGKIRLGEKPRDFEYAFGRGPDGDFRVRYLEEVHD